MLSLVLWKLDIGDCLVIHAWSLGIALKLKSSRRKYSDQVIIEGEEHQEDDEDQADLLGNLHFLDTERSSQNGLQS